MLSTILFVFLSFVFIAACTYGVAFANKHGYLFLIPAVMVLIIDVIVIGPLDLTGEEEEISEPVVVENVCDCDQPQQTVETSNDDYCDIGYYYIGAELRSQDEYTATFIDENGDMWVWEKQEWDEFDPDFVYLLCCHNEGTEDPYDDTLMVVWTESRVHAVG